MMKKVAITLFGISVFAGLGYVAFAKTPIGKSSLIKWLLKKWSEAAKKKDKELDKEQLKAELQKLKYNDLEMLVAFTWSFPVLPEEKYFKEATKQKFEKKYKKLIEEKIFKTADLSQMENIVFPG